ncbi:MAG: S9 family peptidase [Acidobacteriota bacterium]
MNSLRFARISILAASVVLLLPALQAQTTPSPATAAPPARAGRGMRFPGPSSVAMSPDGATIAWTLRGREGATLHLTSSTNPDPALEKIITPNGATACGNTDPVWSADSNWLAFTSTCTSKQEKPGQEEIFVWSRASGEVKQLTHLIGNINQAAFSPDGKTLAFLFVENATRGANALEAMKPWAGVIGEDGLEIQRVWAVDLATGAGAWLTPAALHIYEFNWAPDSRQIAYIAAAPPGTNNWWVAKLYKQEASLKSQPKVVLDPNTTHAALHGLQIAVPRWSPDGSKIAVIGGLMSDQGSTGGDVWVVPSKGGEPTDVTPDIDGTPTFEAWLSDKEIGFVEDRRGHTWTVDYDAIHHSQIAANDLGEVSLSGGTIKNAVVLSKACDFAFVMSGPTKGAEVFTDIKNKVTQLTHLSQGTRPGPKFESIEWENEGFHVQGWLTYPKDYDPSKKYPLIVEVHGGPSASAGPRPETMWSDLGYFVLNPNPRGSYGQGEKFTMANRKDFGKGDLRDILKGLDTVEAKFPIDKHREGLTGWSYGGFMSMFASTQTGRFAAIVAGAGISNWQSYYGENSIDQWMVPFFGASVYDDPDVYAKASAITYIHKAAEYKTPMLIIVGDRDGECPAPQSFEMWHALRDLGVTTQLVIYPNEGHGFSNPEHIRDRNEREAAWFAKYMPAK